MHLIVDFRSAAPMAADHDAGCSTTTLDVNKHASGGRIG